MFCVRNAMISMSEVGGPIGKSCSVFRVRVVRDVSRVRSCAPARRYPGGPVLAAVPCPSPPPCLPAVIKDRSHCTQACWGP